ncbi:hypothetical protein DFH27DRAFT_524409 [Peziza echinospora]|nr:hypothetical protein DFH27DRAFT_524409 [Peziza echinospora]
MSFEAAPKGKAFTECLEASTRTFKSSNACSIGDYPELTLSRQCTSPTCWRPMDAHNEKLSHYRRANGCHTNPQCHSSLQQGAGRALIAGDGYSIAADGSLLIIVKQSPRIRVLSHIIEANGRRYELSRAVPSSVGERSIDRSEDTARKHPHILPYVHPYPGSVGEGSIYLQTRLWLCGLWLRHLCLRHFWLCCPWLEADGSPLELKRANTKVNSLGSAGVPQVPTFPRKPLVTGDSSRAGLMVRLTCSRPKPAPKPRHAPT